MDHRSRFLSIRKRCGLLDRIPETLGQVSTGLHSGPRACNFPVLHPYFLRAAFAGALVAGCSAPVCRPELVAQDGRCVPLEPRSVQCEPACSPAAHEVCDGNAESPSCICAPGYDGNPCAWAGVLDDPGFQDQDAWTLTNGATVLPFARGSIDDGVGVVSESVACNAGAVSQSVQMPSYEAGEPLVAQVTYRAQGLYGLALGFNRAQTQLPATSNDDWRTERVCLGEAAYGGAVTLRLGSPEQHPSCFDEAEGEIEMDRLDVVPANPGECPAPGEVLNGTAEVGGGGWQFETTAATPADLVEGVGRGATSGVQLVVEASVGAAAWTRLSVPSSESLHSPALRFWWKGTNEQPFVFQIGRYTRISTNTLQLDDVYGNGSDVSSIYCLPPWTHGNVVDLIFKNLADLSLDGSSELAVDDVELVSDARCGASSDLLDPGFDAGPTRIMGVSNFGPYQAATLRTEPSLSRTEDGGVLEISYWNEAAVMWLETWVLVPESDGDSGPAFFYWSNVPSVNDKPIRSVLGRAAVAPAFLPAGGGWQESPPICLPPEWSGRWFRIQWRLGDIPPSGETPVDPPIRIYIDDLRLTTDAACPSARD